jgi:hypothetical protein
MLKKETHLLSDFSHMVQSQACDGLAVNTDRSRVGLFKADNESQQHAFSRAAASEHSQSLPAVYVKAYSVENFMTSKRFMQILDSNERRYAASLYILLLFRIVISCGHVQFTRASTVG